MAIRMKPLMYVLALLSAQPLLAVETPVPVDFRGDWIAVGQSCVSKLRLRVGISSVSLINGPEVKEFGDIDICHSCTGGAHYGGIEVWLIPEFNQHQGKTPFIVYFNSRERKGITVVEFADKDLSAKFPLNKRKLRKCKH